MTREERENAIDIIQSILDKYEEDECLAAEITIGDEDIEALKMAIKALEQEPILDKIRAEIEEYKSRKLTLAIGVNDLEEGKQIALEYVLAILDKYKAESEVEDAN